MNFGRDLTDDYGHTTVLHEIGHTLGMPHEHQNPPWPVATLIIRVWYQPAYVRGPPFKTQVSRAQ